MVGRSLLSVFFSLMISQISAQQLDFNDVKKLGSGVNSTAEEGMPLLSNDGKKLYFSRALSDLNEGGMYGGQDIWISERSNGEWSKATNRVNINNRDNNVVVGLDKDGKTIYYVDASHARRMNGIYFSQSNGGKMSKPELIPIPGITNLDFIGFYVSPDRDVIFISMKASDTIGQEDLYYTVKDATGLWLPPRSLGATVNTTGFEISPFLSADKKRLYFATNGRSGLGDADIYYTERVYESWETWSLPVNLGPVVNSSKFDAFFSIYGDSVAYFTSNREGKYADIYSVKVGESKSILEKGQHYLTVDEWNSTIGKNVSGAFAFPHKSTLLSAAQKELLFFIVNKIMLERDYKFHLVVKEEEDGAYSKERVTAIQAHLRQLGLGADRIKIDQVFDIEKTQRGVIELRLFK